MANTVSVETAAVDALVAWIASQLTDIHVTDLWPDEGIPFMPSGEVTVLMAGRVDAQLVLPPQVQKMVPDPPPAVTANYWFRTHFCQQPLQLDVWATSKYRRDDIVNRLGDALTAGKAQTLSPAFFAAENISPNQDPVVQSIVLQLAPPWDFLVGAYQFDAPETQDSASSSKVREYRATYRGASFFDRCTGRNLPQLLNVSLRLTRSYRRVPPASPTTVASVTSTSVSSPPVPGSVLVPPGSTTVTYANPWVLIDTTAGDVTLLLPARGSEGIPLTFTVWAGTHSFTLQAPAGVSILDPETGALGNTFTPTPPAPGGNLVSATYTFAWSNAVSAYVPGGVS